MLVRSGNDPGEQQAEDALDPPPDYVVSTAGKDGGRWVGEDRTTGTWKAAELPGEPKDSYGAGDSFAAALAYALGAGMPIQEALELASRAGASKMTGRARRLREPAHRGGPVIRSTAAPRIAPARSRSSASSA